MAEVRVIIQDSKNGNETITKKTAPTVKDKEEEVAANPSQTKIAKTNNKNLAIAVMLAKQSINYASSNVGKWTGNKHNQAVVNNITDIVAIGMLAKVNPAIAVAVTGFRIATTIIDEQFEQKQQRLASERSLARGGFNDLGEAIGFRRNK